MKQLLKAMSVVIAFLFALNLSASAQKDSTPIEKIPLMSYEMYSQIINKVVADVPARYADEVRAKFTAEWQQLAAWYQQRKVQPQTKEQPKK